MSKAGWFVRDSSLEGTGFEPPVPACARRVRRLLLICVLSASYGRGGSARSASRTARPSVLAWLAPRTSEPTFTWLSRTTLIVTPRPVQHFGWGRQVASRRDLKQLLLTDIRKSVDQR